MSEKVAIAYDQALAVSYGERTDWHAGTIYVVTAELHFTRVKVFVVFVKSNYVHEKCSSITFSKVFFSQPKKNDARKKW